MNGSILRHRNRKMWRFTTLFLFLLLPLLFTVVTNPFELQFPSSKTTMPLDRGVTNPIQADDPSDYGTPVSGYENDKLNALGEIEITSFRSLGDIDEDNLFYDALHVTPDYKETEFDFVDTIFNASADNAEGNNYQRESYVRIRLSDTVFWEYTENVSDEIVGFSPDSQSYTTLHSIQINGSDVDEDLYYQEYLAGSDGTINVFYYNFSSYYDTSVEGNFTLTYLYDVDIIISSWVVSTNVISQEGTHIASNTSIAYYNDIDGITDEISQIFEYNVTFGSLQKPLDAEARFTVYFPDADTIYDVDFGNFDGSPYSPSSEYFENNVLEIREWVLLDRRTSLDATFYANYTIEFIDTVGGEARWCEDRLTEGLNMRERSYKMTITEGPEDLMCIYFGFNVTDIYYSELIVENTVRSKLGRSASVVDRNDTIAHTEDELITEDINGVVLLSRGTPYNMFLGEVDIITLRYEAESELAYTVGDNIKVPIPFIQTRVYLQEQLYGTQISQFVSIPLGIQETDENGQVQLSNMPRGIYRIDVLDDNGVVIGNFTADTSLSVTENILVTNIVHFPQIIIVFGVISVLALGIGYLVFRKNRS